MKNYFYVFMIAFAIAAGVVACAAFVFLVRALYLQFFTKGHFVKKAARELHISKSEVEARFQLVLHEAQAMCKANGAEMRFSHFYPSSKLNDFGFVTSFKSLRLITYAPM